MMTQTHKASSKSSRPSKRRRPRGSTSVDLGSTTKQDLRAIIRQASGSPTGVPMTRAVSAVVRKFRRLQAMADDAGFIHVCSDAADGRQELKKLTLDLNLE